MIARLRSLALAALTLASVALTLGAGIRWY